MALITLISNEDIVIAVVFIILDSSLTRREMLLLELRDRAENILRLFLTANVRENCLDDLELIVVIDDGEVIFIVKIRAIATELTSTERMICADRNTASTIADRTFDAISDLIGSFFRESEEENVSSRNSVLDHICSTLDQRKRLARTRSCGNQAETFIILNDFFLRVVQFLKDCSLALLCVLLRSREFLCNIQNISSFLCILII